MTFNDIILHMFKANARRYVLYFLCNSFTVMLLFAYSTLMTNKDFMDYSKVSSAVSGNMIAPSIVLAVFSVFFIMYTQNSFIRYRKTEFGLFMVLGMTNKDIGRIMLFENGIIAFMSLAAGLAAGTLFSGIFYFIMIKITGINVLSFSINYKSYLYTAAFFSAIYIIVISVNLIISLRYDIVTMLKSSRRKDKSFINGKAAALTGIAAISISIFDFVNNFRPGQSAIFLRSPGLCIIGIYLLISSFIWFLEKLLKTCPEKYNRNLLFVSDMNYNFNQSKKIMTVISLLVSITIFFSSVALAFLSDSENYAVKHNPYDIAYAEIYGKNEISEGSLNSIIKNGETSLTSYKKLKFIGFRDLTVLSDKDMNTVLGTSIHVQKGNFINLLQIVEKDGYQHNTFEMKKAYIPTKEGNYILNSQGSMKQMLFGNMHLMTNSQYLIVNEDDYAVIKGKANPYEYGYINLMNFKDWKKTGAIAEKLQKALESYNRANTRQYYGTKQADTYMFRPISKIGTYAEEKQSASFLLFLLVFVGILFYISSGAILHFKLMTEFESEKVKYRKLYKIGITENEASGVISKELAVMFFMPYIFAILMASFYSSVPLSVSIGTKYTISIGYALIIGLICSGLQAVFFAIYKRVYIKKLLSGVLQ